MVQDNDRQDDDRGADDTPPITPDDIIASASSDGGSGGRKRVSLPLIGGLVVAVLVGAVLVLVALSGGGDDDASPDDGVSGGLATGITPTVEANIDLDRPTPVATVIHPTAVAEGDMLVIPTFNVSAPLSLKKVGIDGVMPNPNGPDDIAYYDFSAWDGLGGAPGGGGNAVFSGHVDSGRVACSNGTVPPPCEAVLWDLNRVQVGDEIQVHLNGTIFRYRVTSNQPVHAATGPWQEIVSSTAEESLTIITCGGDFNRETREYTNRQVVTAVKI